MNPFQQPNRASSGAWALPYSKGKASQWPAFTPVPLSKIGLIRHPTSDVGAAKSLSHLWQGGIGSGPLDCNALPATSLGA